MEWKERFPKKNVFFETERGILYRGHVLEILREIPDESVDCVITSPPYWALRDYGEEANTVWGGDPGCKHEWDNEIVVRERGAAGTDNTGNHSKRIPGQEEHKRMGRFCRKCGAWYGQLGLEPTFEMYLEHLWLVFDEIYRILKPTGTLWVNIADTYSGSGKGAGFRGKPKESWLFPKKPKIKESVPHKSLCLIPERFAIGMVERGWILRNVVIWHKPNAMPESVKDRFTVDFEYIYFFVKQRRYYFEQIVEPTHAKVIEKRMLEERREAYSNGKYSHIQPKRTMYRNKRAVWSINTKPFKEAHFAVFPPELAETCIKAGCPEYVCRECGKPREKILERVAKNGWSEYCSCGSREWERGIVLDPFMGSGTVAVVAEKLGRRWIGIEINPDYCEIIKRRIEKESKQKTLPLSEKEQ